MTPTADGWNNLADTPPCGFGEQANVLFCSPGWGWPILGLVTNWGALGDWIRATGSAEGWPGQQYSFMLYLQDKDRFNEWEGPQPTLWTRRPEVPQ